MHCSAIGQHVCTDLGNIWHQCNIQCKNAIQKLQIDALLSIEKPPLFYDAMLAEANNLEMYDKNARMQYTVQWCNAPQVNVFMANAKLLVASNCTFHLTMYNSHCIVCTAKH